MPTTSSSSVTEETVENAGFNIFFRSWTPASGARGVLVIVPGFNSHSGYYGWTAQHLTRLGLSVFAVDLRGRGRSDGERFYVESFEDYVSDVAAVAAIARARHPGVPMYVLGHSAGGVVACLFAAEHQRELAGLICESFAFQVPAPDFALAVFKGLAHVAPHAHVLHLKNRDFSRDSAVVETMDADPLIAHETQPTRTLAEMVRADERLKNAFPSLTLPLFILHGTHDKATRPAGSQQFYDRAGASDKTIKLYEGAFHDLLNDTDKEIVIADITSWIEQRLSR